MPISPADWKGVPAPTVQLLEGRFIRLEKLDPARHADGLFRALEGPGADPKLWDYLPYGPFPERAAFDAWLNNHAANSDPYFFSVIDRATGDVQGILSLMSIVPAQGRIEIGHVTFGAPMQRSPKSTEAVYLLAKYAFEQGYRRLEWKCNNGNARSKYAAERLGFSFEGCFASTWWSRGRTAIPRGIRSWIRNGQPWVPGLKSGCPKRTRRVLVS